MSLRLSGFQIPGDLTAAPRTSDNIALQLSECAHPNTTFNQANHSTEI
jgi:hypothetical protein